MGEGDLKELRELVEFLKASGVAEFDMERPELKVRLTFAQAASTAAATGGVDLTQLARLMAAAGAGAGAALTPAEVAPVQAAVATPKAVAVASGVHAASPLEADEDAGLHIVKSPLVGTFYDASSPAAEAFVKVGDTVAAGKVLCIVEAMKIMNEIESDVAGEIVKVYGRPGQPVEYGQKLFGVRL